MTRVLPKDGIQQHAMEDVLEERHRQDRKWGKQDHPPEWWLVILGEEYGEACQAALADMFTRNRCTGEKRSGEYRKELVQVAAVALAAIERFDIEEGADE